MAKTENKIFWDFKNYIANESVDLYIYNEIAPWEDEECTSATAFKKELDNIGEVETINLYVNSPGGSVSDGLAIANMLKRHKAKVIAYVDGLACSIASVIVCSADVVIMYRNSMMMIHDALAGGFMYNNAKGYRKLADDLDKMTASLRQTYLEKAKDKLDEEKLTSLMSEESWLSAKDCFELGLCDEILENNKMVASMSVKFAGYFNAIPDNVLLSTDNILADSNEEDEVDNKLDLPLEENSEDLSEEESANKEDEIIEDEIIEDDNKATEEDEVQEDEVQEENEGDEKLKEEIENLKAEKEKLENKLNQANEKIITLNDTVMELEKIKVKYDAEQELKAQIELEKRVNEKKEFYENKFTKLGAKAQFNSNKVQELIKNCIADEKALSELNLMIVDLIEVDNKKIVSKDILENATKIENLIPISETVEEKYGFK